MSMIVSMTLFLINYSFWLLYKGLIDFGNPRRYAGPMAFNAVETS